MNLCNIWGPNNVTISGYVLHCRFGSVAKILRELVNMASSAFLLSLDIFSDVGVLSYNDRN